MIDTFSSFKEVVSEQNRVLPLMKEKQLEYVKFSKEEHEQKRVLNLPREKQWEYVEAQTHPFRIDFYRLLLHCHEINKKSSGDNLVYIVHWREKFPKNMDLYFGRHSSLQALVTKYPKLYCLKTNHWL